MENSWDPELLDKIANTLSCSDLPHLKSTRPHNSYYNYILMLDRPTVLLYKRIFDRTETKTVEGDIQIPFTGQEITYGSCSSKILSFVATSKRRGVVLLETECFPVMGPSSFVTSILDYTIIDLGIDLLKYKHNVTKRNNVTSLRR